MRAFVPPPLLEDAGREEQERLREMLEAARREGRLEGRQEGWERARRELAPLLQALQEALEELRSLRERIVRRVEGELVELALAIAQLVVRRELDRSGVPPALVRDALEALPRGGEVVLRLNPTDLEVLRGMGEGMLQGVRVEEDPTVPRGGCVVEGELGRVDARPEVQMEEIARRLRERWGTWT